MTPFEDLIRELSQAMGIPLQPDQHQSCRITFREDELAIQIDLDANGDRVLLGSQLGRITPGVYRQQIFTQALRANGGATFPRGILAFSEKNDTLIMFQFLDLAHLTGEKLHQFLKGFRENATLWKKALEYGNVPTIEISIPSRQRGSMYGLRP